MAVRFILGRAGTGKTHHCVGRVVEMCKADPLGPPIFFIVPKQATFQVQRRFVALLSGFSRIRVVSFDQLGLQILEACGDVAIPEVTPTGRLLVIGHVLRRERDKLKFYHRTAMLPGLAAELDETFGEFDRAGVDGRTLDDLLNSMPADADPALFDKLADVRTLLAAYQAFIGQDRLDPAERLRLVLKKVGGCDLFEEAAVFVDDFYDFTDYERQLLTAVARKAASTEISLQHEPDDIGAVDEMATFHRTVRSFTLLKNAFKDHVRVDDPIRCRKPTRFRAPALAAIESTFAGVAATAAGESVTMIEAADRRAEVDAVARKIRDAVIDGRRYRDLCVLARDLSTYHDVIRTIFDEYGIPFFADVRRSATHHPVVQLIRASVLIVSRNWPTDAVLMLVKSGLAGLDDDEADELENVAVDIDARHGDWTAAAEWRPVDNRSAVDIEDEPAGGISVDRLRAKLRNSLSPLLTGGPGPRAVSAWVKSLSDVLENFGVRRQLHGWIKAAADAGDLEQRAEHEQVWSITVELMDQLGKLLGGEQLSAIDFRAVLDSALAGFELAITPPTLDQVLVGQVDRTRTPDVKVTFVMGLNEGEFPKTRSEPAVLSDTDRRSLRKRNLELDQDTERLLLDEKFLGYIAVTRSSEQLVLSRPMADDQGRARTPSRYWRMVVGAAVGAEVESADRQGRAGPNCVGTAGQAVTGAMKWVRDGRPNNGWDAVYQRLASDPEPFARAIEVGWPALRYINRPVLEPATAKGLFPSPLNANAGELETFAECPFRHFARHGLRLRDRRDSDVTGRDVNAVFMAVLDQAVRPGSVFDPVNGDDGLDEAMEQIGPMVEAVRSELRGSLSQDTPRNRYLLEGITRTLRQVVMSAVLVNRLGNLRWTKAAVRFGARAELPALEIETPGGLRVLLHGRIERLDVGPDDRAIVTDYRMSAIKLSLDRVLHGLSLRLLAQLLVIQQSGDRLLGRRMTPAGALTAPLRRSIESCKDPNKAVDPSDEAFHLRHQVVGLFTESAIELLHREVFTGQSPAFNVFRKLDGSLGRVDQSDAISEEQFEAVLRLVETKIGELADGVMSGDVSVNPYEMGGKRACTYCDYRSVCRFDPVLDRYRPLASQARAEVFVSLSVHGEIAEGQ